MIKIMLDPGHGAGRDFNRGSVIGNEAITTINTHLYLKRARKIRFLCRHYKKQYN